MHPIKNIKMSTVPLAIQLQDTSANVDESQNCASLKSEPQINNPKKHPFAIESITELTDNFESATFESQKYQQATTKYTQDPMRQKRHQAAQQMFIDDQSFRNDHD